MPTVSRRASCELPVVQGTHAARPYGGASPVRSHDADTHSRVRPTRLLFDRDRRAIRVSPLPWSWSDLGRRDRPAVRSDRCPEDVRAPFGCVPPTVFRCSHPVSFPFVALRPSGLAANAVRSVRVARLMRSTQSPMRFRNRPGPVPAAVFGTCSLSPRPTASAAAFVPRARMRVSRLPRDGRPRLFRQQVLPGLGRLATATTVSTSTIAFGRNPADAPSVATVDAQSLRARLPERSPRTRRSDEACVRTVPRRGSDVPSP
jgi:hypothetical protein